MATFGKDEWGDPLFCGKFCFKQHRRSLEAAVSKTKGSVPWNND